MYKITQTHNELKVSSRNNKLTASLFVTFTGVDTDTNTIVNGYVDFIHDGVNGWGVGMERGYDIIHTTLSDDEQDMYINPQRMDAYINIIVNEVLIKSLNFIFDYTINVHAFTTTNNR